MLTLKPVTALDPGDAGVRYKLHHATSKYKTKKTAAHLINILLVLQCITTHWVPGIFCTNCHQQTTQLSKSAPLVHARRVYTSSRNKGEAISTHYARHTWLNPVTV